METKLQLMTDYRTYGDKQNRMELAKLICDVLHQKDKKEQSVLEHVTADKALFLCYQNPYQSTTDYLEAFKS